MALLHRASMASGERLASMRVRLSVLMEAAARLTEPAPPVIPRGGEVIVNSSALCTPEKRMELAARRMVHVRRA